MQGNVPGRVQQANIDSHGITKTKAAAARPRSHWGPAAAADGGSNRGEGTCDPLPPLIGNSAGVARSPLLPSKRRAGHNVACEPLWSVPARH